MGQALNQQIISHPMIKYVYYLFNIAASQLIDRLNHPISQQMKRWNHRIIFSYRLQDQVPRLWSCWDRHLMTQWLWRDILALLRCHSSLWQCTFLASAACRCRCMFHRHYLQRRTKHLLFPVLRPRCRGCPRLLLCNRRWIQQACLSSIRALDLQGTKAQFEIKLRTLRSCAKHFLLKALHQLSFEVSINCSFTFLTTYTNSFLH